MGRLAISRDGDLWSIELPTGQPERITNTPDLLEIPAAWSPDGSQLLYTVHKRQSQGPSETWLVRADGSDARRIDSAGGGDSPAWSPDGSRIAFTTPQGIMLANPDGSHAERLGVGGSCLVWSPDASSIAYCAARDPHDPHSTASTVHVIRADGTDDRQVSDPALADAVPGAWNADGTSLAYAGTQAGNGGFDVFRADLQSDTSRVIMRRPGAQFVAAGSSDGALLVADYDAAPDSEWPQWLALGPHDDVSTVDLPTHSAGDHVAWLDSVRGSPTAPPPLHVTLRAGQMRVGVGGRSLMVECHGTGEPVVVLDAPLGSDSSTWIGVQQILDRRHRVCRYDRAGLGASDPAPAPRDARAAAVDLDRVVRALKTRQPVILVGASFGGFVAQLYAFTKPGSVAALVLVDSIHPDLDRRIEALLGPDESASRRVLLEQNSEGIRFADLLRSDQEVAAARTRLSIPVIVLRHGLPFTGGPHFPQAKVERLWKALQDDLARLSATSEVWVARRSHHRIAEYQPDLVARAVEWVWRRTK